MESQWNHKIFTINDLGFEPLAIEIFRYQYSRNSVYHEYVNALHINVPAVQSIMQVPFLPIRFFKSHSIQTTDFTPDLIFESSGTTGSVKSRHLLKDRGLYEESFIKGFERMYGPIKEWCIVGVMPSFPERANSSLVYMVNGLIRQSHHVQSGFYLQEHDKLYSVLVSLERAKQKTILIGLAFALLDFAEKYASKFREPLEHTIVMETGGMKGRREEMTRMELHDVLRSAFKIPVVHSEYGMTEILSQAYSNGSGIFSTPPWMKVLIRDDEDPLHVKTVVKSEDLSKRLPFRPTAEKGAINIIDLANIYSCSFIATDDAGSLYDDGSFEVLGRIDNSDLRGCSLLMV